MWCIVGTLPNAGAGLLTVGLEADSRVEDSRLLLPGGHAVPVRRGTAALAAAAIMTCQELGLASPRLLLAGDVGDGAGSRAVYAWLEEHLPELAPDGLTFHYLFPDVDGHNRVLMAAQALPQRPVLVADAGFMYAAKMSGYADRYDLFTPDIGELAFLADEKAPNPFYTRGFLLAREDDALPLIRRAAAHGNCPQHLLVKGSTDYVVTDGNVTDTVKEPAVPAMECIGGTGDLLAGLVTAFLCGNAPLREACAAASRTARRLAAHCAPDPGTSIDSLIARLPAVLRRAGDILPPFRT